MRVCYRILLCLLLFTAVTFASDKTQPSKHKPKAKAKTVMPAKVDHEKTSARAREEFENLPPALARHLERLRAMPGNGGLSGPGTPEEESFMFQAYPDTDIPLARFVATRAAMTALRGRPLARGKGKTGTWVTVGPSIALYPEFVFRTAGLYVPDEYVASGRTTSLAISTVCVPGHCRLWAGPAGGGIWRTDNALTGEPHWTYLSTPFGINAIGAIAVDPNDPTGNTIYVGTGEANASADSAAGVGLYKSTDGGDTWTGPLGSPFNGRGIGTIAVTPGNPSVLYVGITRAVRGVNSTDGGGVTLIPGAAQWGLYKSTDAGATWTFIHNGAALASSCSLALDPTNTGPCSPRGVRRVVIDPSDPNTVYAGSYARGIWRSSDAGATWTQIKASLNAADTVTRPEFAVNKTADGKTRMYVNEGNDGANPATFFRADDVAHGSPTFMQLSSSNPADPGYGAFNLCGGQCWYDNFVVSPPGNPDVVYAGGSYSYGETGGISNGRGVVISTDGGHTFTDMTMDATDAVHPNGLHPDQHFLVTNPSNPYQFWESGDGGIMMSSGSFADISAFCGFRTLSATSLARCQQLLSRVPTQLQSMNKGISSLQFQSLSVNPFDSNDLQGGTQDNGTWESFGNQVKWLNTMIGDGGQSGFDIADRNFRFHTFFDAQVDVNFSGGTILDWNWIADVLLGEPQQFYVPIISDPAVSGTMFVGTSHVWRTKTHGIGTMTVAEYRSHCNEWTGDFPKGVVCGDWQPLGDPTSAGRLTATAFGNRSGGDVASVRRAASDSSTLWAATSTGRVFISKNADADPASSVAFTRIDIATSPNRYVSEIAVDPADANHAWVVYNGYTASTPATPGHVFEVRFDPNANTATWTSLDYDLGDVPLTSIAYDSVLGDLYAATDYGVILLAKGSTSWTIAAPGMPNVETPSLTIVPGARKLYAATHGLGAWLLNLQ
ncbi:MAG TPA: sialidase family protein [Terriglobales bacterium]|nr:sialidase family protein [Terriglobales bacterium]